MDKRKSGNKDVSDRKHSSPKSRMVILTSIAIVVIFIAIIAIGVIRERSSEKKPIPTDEQMTLTRNIISSSLKDGGDDISRYNLTFSKRVKYLEQYNESREILQVCLSGNATRHTYLIDLNTRHILMHTQTDIYTTDEKFIRYAHEDNGCYFRD